MIVIRFFQIASVLFCALLAFPVLAQDERTAGAEAEKNQGFDETYRQLQLFGDVFERVREQYVEPVNDQKLIENAVNGMLSNLDPHSGYLTQKEFDEMKVQTKGEFGGLGIEVTMENGLVKVVSPIDDTPAARAGVKPGDFITYIDGKPVIGLTLGDAVDKMRGKPGSEIKLTIRREKTPEPIKLTLIRDIIKVQSVRSRTIGNAGYIRITSFTQNTEAGVIKAVDEIRKKLGDKLAGYIIDLRNDPGGLLDQAIAVSDLFLEKGEIVSTRGRSENDTKRDNATAGDITNGLPIVVIINGGTASAAEIVSGALQDHKRAILLGTKSFGKGSVQTVIPVPGHGAIRLTTARYYTPSGRSIQAEGIEPDIVVEQSKIETAEAQESIHESDLPGALDKGKNSSDPAKKSEPRSDIPPMPPEDPKNKTLDEEAAKDYQLQRALDLLNGLALYKSGETRT